MQNHQPVREIVPATEDDLEEIVRIERLSFRDPFSRDLFANELKLDIAHLLVLKTGVRVVGYIDFWHVDREIHLIDIAVAPELRRQGTGTELMKFLIDYATSHQIEEISLDVRVSNTGAVKLYQQFDFETVGLRKGYYRDNNEDAQVMRMLLPSADRSP
jgi:ribosomal-protein-alanine N-acetyltransferase